MPATRTGTRETLRGPAALITRAKRVGVFNDKKDAPKPDRESDWPIVARGKATASKRAKGANRLTKPAQATRCRTNDGLTLADLPASDTRRVSLKSPVRYVVNTVMWSTLLCGAEPGNPAIHWDFHLSRTT